MAMDEIFRRLLRSPKETGYFLVTALLVNLLGFASSIYVMQVLNRYVSHGVGGTLVALTTGAILAVVGEFVFRNLRLQLAQMLAEEGGEQLATSLFGLLLTIRVQEIIQQPARERTGFFQTLMRAETVVNASMLATLSDVPFAILYLAVLWLLSPAIGGTATLFLIIGAVLSWWSPRQASQSGRSLQETTAEMTNLGRAILEAPDSVRQFRSQSLAMHRWHLLQDRAMTLRRTIARHQGMEQALGMLLQGIMGVAVIAVGAMQAVEGKMDVGSLIAANILAARALIPLTRTMAMATALQQARDTLERARGWMRIPLESSGGVTIPQFTGQVVLQGVSCHFAGEHLPLFSKVNARIDSGKVVAVTGRNGSGKSTLLAMLAGLRDVQSGTILVDDIDLRLINQPWWRTQVSYMPQDPVFMEGTLWENLVAAQPELSRQQGEQWLVATGLDGYLRSRGQSIDLAMVDGGRTLPAGIRKRMGLARALAVGGQLCLLDEPTEGVDIQTRGMLNALMVTMARQGRTLIIATHDEKMIAGAGLVIDLDQHAGSLP